MLSGEGSIGLISESNGSVGSIEGSSLGGLNGLPKETPSETDATMGVRSVSRGGIRAVGWLIMGKEGGIRAVGWLIMGKEGGIRAVGWLIMGREGGISAEGWLIGKDGNNGAEGSKGAAIDGAAIDDKIEGGAIDGAAIDGAAIDDRIEGGAIDGAATELKTSGIEDVEGIELGIDGIEGGEAIAKDVADGIEIVKDVAEGIAKEVRIDVSAKEGAECIDNEDTDTVTDGTATVDATMTGTTIDPGRLTDGTATGTPKATMISMRCGKFCEMVVSIVKLQRRILSLVQSIR